MTEKTLNEPILEDNYPVYIGYYYVVDGKVVISDFNGTAYQLKTSMGAAEIRRCDMVGRDLF